MLLNLHEHVPCVILSNKVFLLLLLFQFDSEVGEARAIWDVGHYGKSLYLQNSESSNCMCMFHYSTVIWRLRRASNIYIL